MNKKTTYLALPYFFWAIIFTVLPLLLVFMFAVFRNDGEGYYFTTEYLSQLIAGKDEIIAALIRSLKLSAIATVVCLILGYPLAYILANSKSKYKSLLTTLIILPMWMNFLVRTYALLSLMENSGLINQFLGLFGIERIQFLYKESSIAVGMIYNYLPFMVLPIHSVLSKMDNRLIEAAEDLGANKFRVFTKVIFPLSLGGVISGIEMVFIPSITTFALSQILGGSKTLLIGDMIERQFLEFNNWGYGSLLSVIVIVIVLLCMFITSRFGSSDNEGGLLG
ncbi:MAG: ABC transporter permease [Clostridia bacterium]|nr:ABC transporter permease [Clostridia bacterium]